jgi:hypothetical protein
MLRLLARLVSLVAQPPVPHHHVISPHSWPPRTESQCRQAPSRGPGRRCRSQPRTLTAARGPADAGQAHGLLTITSARWERGATAAWSATRASRPSFCKTRCRRRRLDPVGTTDWRLLSWRHTQGMASSALAAWTRGRQRIGDGTPRGEPGWTISVSRRAG